MRKITLKDVTPDATTPGQNLEIAGSAGDAVAPGRRVTLHFELALQDGAVIDSNFAGRPARFCVGDGNLPATFEAAILGMCPGDERSLELLPGQAFGEYREENIQTFPRHRFPADLVMERGLVVNFADAAGNGQPGVVKEFDADCVTVDFNHPLAGRAIRFRARILAVDAPIARDP